MLLLLFSVAGKPRAREKHKRLPAWLFFRDLSDARAFRYNL